MATEWEKKHEANAVLDAFRAAYRDAKRQGMTDREAGEIARQELEYARRRYRGEEAV